MRTTLILLLCPFLSLFTYAQDIDWGNVRAGESVEYCKTHKKEKELLLNPVYLKMAAASKAIHKAQEEELKKSSSPHRGVVYTIPVAFHVLHQGGVENISRNQILDALRVLNRDFRAQNPDTANVTAAFLGQHADVEIEFVLASKAPDGKCFGGITRTYSAMAYDGSDGFDQVNAIRLGNDTYQGDWPGNQYLNFFVCGDIGGAAGYTYLPSGWLNEDMENGIWLRHDYVGGIGTSTESHSRVLTHECGHWLNLNHTWGGNNNPGNATSCSTDDDITDTPNTIGVQACILWENTCGVLANVENYMDYSYCSKMFTQGQADRMRAALLSSIAGRNNLWQPSNLLAVGAVNPALCKADFTTQRVVVCEGDTVHFDDQSHSGVVAWKWDFDGQNASSLTDEHPYVVYDAPGVYDVGLTVYDGVDSVSTLEQGYIMVQPALGNALPFSEGFEVLSDLSNETWRAINHDGGLGFEIEDQLGYTGSHSVKIDNSENFSGDIDELVSSAYDLSNLPSAQLSFRYAFAKKNDDNTDQLRILVSKNCGQTWTVRKVISINNLPTAPNTNGEFEPTWDQWNEVVIANFTSTHLIENFMYKFVFYAGGGNDFYLDHINLGGPASIEEIELNDLKVWPNPSKGTFNVRVNGENGEEGRLTLVDIVGRDVSVLFHGNIVNQDLNFSVPSSGIYFLRYTNSEGSKEKRIIVQ